MKGPAVLGPACQYGQPPEVHVLARLDDLLARRRADGLRKRGCQVGQARQGLQFLEQAIGRLRVEQRREPRLPLVVSRKIERREHPPARPEHVDRDRHRRALDVFEQQGRPPALDGAVRDLGDLQTGRALDRTRTRSPSRSSAARKADRFR